MKTTLELPDTLFRKAKATAAARGQSLKDLFTEALHEKLAAPNRRSSAQEPPWMSGFGELKQLSKETVRLLQVIDSEFEVVKAEGRA